jgi:hypothetical protein
MSDNPRNDLLDILEAISESQLRTIRKLRGPQASATVEGEQPRERMSHIDMVQNILSSVRRPLHISDILELVS